MNIKQLSEIVKNKLDQNITCEKIEIQDKTFLHKNHATHDKNKFHLSLIITSNYLKKKSKIDATKEIYKVLNNELENHIHSIQISIS